MVLERSRADWFLPWASLGGRQLAIRAYRRRGPALDIVVWEKRRNCSFPYRSTVSFPPKLLLWPLRAAHVARPVCWRTELLCATDAAAGVSSRPIVFFSDRADKLSGCKYEICASSRLFPGWKQGDWFARAGTAQDKQRCALSRFLFMEVWDYVL